MYNSMLLSRRYYQSSTIQLKCQVCVLNIKIAMRLIILSNWFVNSIQGTE